MGLRPSYPGSKPVASPGAWLVYKMTPNRNRVVQRCQPIWDQELQLKYRKANRHNDLRGTSSYTLVIKAGPFGPIKDGSSDLLPEKEAWCP